MKKLLLLLVFHLFFFSNSNAHTLETILIKTNIATISSATINYNSPICVQSFSENVIITGNGNYLGGVFSSTSGLNINVANGMIDPSSSLPGTYMVIYSVPANIPFGEPGFSTSAVVVITPAVIPTFQPIYDLCQNISSPNLPSTSTNGIAGTWSPSTIDTSILGTTVYTFTPNSGQCAVPTTINITITPATTLTLMSAAATANQTVCFNEPIQAIDYNFGCDPNVPAITFTGLPYGLIGNYSGNTVTITGVPIEAGFFFYTITATWENWFETLTGFITVNPVSTISTNNSSNVICVDYLTNSVESTLLLESSVVTSGGSSNHTYQWYMNGVAIAGATNANYLVNTADSSGSPRIFTVALTDIIALGCPAISAGFQVIQSGSASPIGIGYSIVNNAGNQTLTVEVQGYGIYGYSLDGGSVQNSPIFTNVPLGNHFINIVDLNGCGATLITNIDVNLIGTQSPTGSASQQFTQGATLADLSVNGQNIQWYSSSVGKMLNNTFTSSTALPLNTLLVDATTYYASQKIGGYESTSRLPVTTQLVLSNHDFELKGLSYQPNPVISNLNLKSEEIMDSIIVYNLVGQMVLNQNVNKYEAQIDLSILNSGTYFVKVSSTNKQKTFKIVKK